MAAAYLFAALVIVISVIITMDMSRAINEIIFRNEEKAYQLATVQRITKAVQEANRGVEIELHRIVKKHGTEIFNDTEIAKCFAKTFEQALDKHDTRLKELWLTPETLVAKMNNYVKRVQELQIAGYSMDVTNTIDEATVARTTLSKL